MKMIASGIAALFVVAAALVFNLASGLAQQLPTMDNGMPSDQMQQMMQQHQHQMMQMHGQSGQTAEGTTPTMPGEDAFGAIQEIVRLLEADPSTDWSKVNLEALRQHLID